MIWRCPSHSVEPARDWPSPRAPGSQSNISSQSYAEVSLVSGPTLCRTAGRDGSTEATRGRGGGRAARRGRACACRASRAGPGAQRF
eukprot:scaffold51448_cov64-Phaeocystis_antarctica.AAC.2